MDKPFEEMTEDELDAIRQRTRGEACYSTSQTKEYLKLLEKEVVETGTCSEQRAAEILKQFTPVRRAKS